MKNPEKQLSETLTGMCNNSYCVIDDQCGLRRIPSNNFLYYQYEKMSIEAQEEIGRRNKSILRKEAMGNPFLGAKLKKGEV
jgi:hypothetical protein